MGLAILFLFALSIVASLIISYSFLKTKKYALSVIFLGVFLRLCFALIIESGAKYDLAWDSLKYESDAWMITKSWISQIPIQVERPNFYSYWLAILFYLFNKSSLLGVWFNILFSVISSILLLKALAPFFPKSNSPGLIFSGLVALYPSWFAWSVVLIKDPLLILASSLVLYGLILFFNSNRKFFGSVLLILGSVLCYQLRIYTLYFFAIALSVALIWLLLQKLFKPRMIILVSFLSFIPLVYLWTIFWPDDFHNRMQDLIHQRITFANYGIDDFAKSSFLIRPQLNSAFDLILFEFKVTLYYFLAPFIWTAENLRQTVSLVESIPLFFIIVFAVKGFLRSESIFPKFTLFILALILVPSFIQSNAVSNMGTIFRVRTFFIILLFYFAEWGITKMSTVRKSKFDGIQDRPYLEK